MAKVRKGDRYDIRSGATTVVVGTLAYLAASNCDEDTISTEIEVPDNLVNADGKYLGETKWMTPTFADLLSLGLSIVLKRLSSALPRKSRQ